MQRRWDRDDLERRLCHALDVGHRAVARLGLTGYAETNEPDERIRPEKVICETALLLMAASNRGNSDAVRTRIDECARVLLPHARSPRMLLGICMQPSLALEYASAHLYLTRIGHPDPAFDAVLREALRSAAHRAKERAPHRELEQEWLLRMCGHGCPRRSAWLLRASALGRPMDLLGGTRDDLYAFTHAIMYARDFDIHPLPLPRSRAAILAEGEAALARCLEEEDYDLGGEVLLAWPLTGKSWSAAATFAFRVLAAVEDRAGFLPSAGTRLDRLRELEGEEREKYLLATAYHTIFVMGLLCAAALVPGKNPPLCLPARAARPGAAARMLEFIDDDSRTAHYWEQFRQLTTREQDALAGLLFKIALRRKVGQRDFGALARLLAAGDALGLTDSPAASQSAEMLGRLAVFAKQPRAAVASA